MWGFAGNSARSYFVFTVCQFNLATEFEMYTSSVMCFTQYGKDSKRKKNVNKSLIRSFAG